MISETGITTTGAARIGEGAFARVPQSAAEKTGVSC